ncbi:MAG: DUF1810 domain-containing protein [Gluconacetobacter diazotrophicus]|nr:DUF1810 domain-containing protein [Gluconacetobacter diazotrophicus]
MDDPFDLHRFVAAQDPVMDQVRTELRAGRKRSHWIWFVFPQAEGLGHSAMAKRYGIGSRAEAEAYLAHPVLGGRLRDCLFLVDAHRDRTLHDILGSPDDLKFRSSMTLFAAVAPPDDQTFADALARWCDGPDTLTERLLRRPGDDLS